MDYLANMSGKKASNLIGKFYEANITEEHKNSEDIKRTMSGLTADEVENIVFANKADYISLVEEKFKEGIGPEICLKKDERGFNIAFYNDTNYYDLSRPQSELDIGSKREKIKKQLKKVNNHEKVIVVFGGNLLGEEWKLANLRNASIVGKKEIIEEISSAVSSSKKITQKDKEDIISTLEDSNGAENSETKAKVERIVAYFGIKKRLEQLRNDIRTYYSVAKSLNISDLDIILLNGAEEHDVKKKFNFDPLEKVYLSMVKSFPSISYVNEGVSVIFPVFTNGKGANSNHISLNIQTNSSSKAVKARSVERAALMDNGPSDSSACFRLNVANFSGFYNGVYYPTGQSTFSKVKKGAKPPFSPQDRDVYHIDITKDDTCEITRGGVMDLKAYSLEVAIKEEQLKRECISEVLLEIMEERINALVNEKTCNGD